MTIINEIIQQNIIKNIVNIRGHISRVLDQRDKLQNVTMPVMIVGISLKIMEFL